MVSLEELDKRLKNLELAFLQMSTNSVTVTNRADAGYNKVQQVDDNTSNIHTNSEDIVKTQEGLTETYEETTTSITQLEEALAEAYEIIVSKE